MVRPKNIHTANTAQTEHIIFKNIYIYISVTSNEKRGCEFEVQQGERHVEVSVGRNGKGEI